MRKMPYLDVFSALSCSRGAATTCWPLSESTTFYKMYTNIITGFTFLWSIFIPGISVILNSDKYPVYTYSNIVTFISYVHCMYYAVQIYWPIHNPHDSWTSNILADVNYVMWACEQMYAYHYAYAHCASACTKQFHVVGIFTLMIVRDMLMWFSWTVNCDLSLLYGHWLSYD
jgi:hypothetical protein